MNALANAAAIILAGGKISPMGTPKFLLDFAGEPLIS
jgi:molybdopterin-guanine dinucleotide biosynthesis protein A